MNIRELIKELSKLDPELTVLIEADHGQHPEEASDPIVSWYREEDGELIHDDDVDEYQTHEISKIVVIYGQ